MILTIAAGILLAVLALKLLRALPYILVILLVLYLVGSLA